MAGSLRAGASAFWTTIRDLSLASAATAKDMYTDGINRLSDRTVWLRDALTKQRADLANTTAGTRAIVTGSVDLSGIVYDATAGALNGLTLQTQGDTGGIVTTTFGSGAGAPTSAADVVTAVLSAIGAVAQTASVDAAGHLSMSSTTTGSGSTINIVGGSAVSVLGFTVGQNAAGVSSGADGLSAIGGASIAGTRITLAAGTLRSMLAALLAYVDARTTGGTTVLLTNTSQTIDISMGTTFACADPASAGINIAVDTAGAAEGDRMVLTRAAGSAHVIQIMNTGIGIIGTLPSSTRSSIQIQYMNLNDGEGITWRVIGGTGHTVGAVG